MIYNLLVFSYLWKVSFGDYTIHGSLLCNYFEEKSLKTRPITGYITMFEDDIIFDDIEAIIQVQENGLFSLNGSHGSDWFIKVSPYLEIIHQCPNGLTPAKEGCAYETLINVEPEDHSLQIYLGVGSSFQNSLICPPPAEARAGLRPSCTGKDRDSCAQKLGYPRWGQSRCGGTTANGQYLNNGQCLPCSPSNKCDQMCVFPFCRLEGCRDDFCVGICDLHYGKNC
uniref:Uncharacterized protein n=1 Tax=Ditylenchus dipsaci TaxID=166011 RepID=A0A915CNH9_9BILA